MKDLAKNQELENEVKALRDENQQLRAELKKRDEVILELQTENKLLRQKIDLLVRKVFGASSEALDASQLDLFLAESAPGKAPAPAEGEPPLGADSCTTRRRTPPADKRLPDDLPVIEEVIDPQEVKQAPEQWRCIGQEVSEQLDYEPARFLRRRLIRRKYVSKTFPLEAPVIAELPPLLLERGMVAPGLLAQIVVGKYCDHLPLYRQEQIYWTRHGVWLSRQNLSHWMELAADWLKPVYQCLQKEVFASGYVQVDETPIRYLDPGNGQTKTGYFWATSRPGGDAVYRWETSRAASCLNNVIPVDFQGTVQCDGYGAYPSFARDKGQIKLAACWAHARRKFYQAQEQDPKVARWLLNQIGQLYRLERELRERQGSREERTLGRQTQARPVYQRLHRVLTQLKLKGRYLPRSGMGQALDYTLNLWPQLGVYLDDGLVEIDNNLVENAIRPTAVGKKNWLFIGAAEAGERSAILYTLVESCRRRGIDPYAYLRDVLTRLPSSTNWQVKDLTPQAWAQARVPLQQAA